MRALPLLPRVLAGLALAIFSAAHAAETSGIGFPDRVVFGGRELILNGTATRAVFGVRVYAAGLYVSRASSDAEEITNQNTDPKHLRIVLLRVVPEDKFASAVRDNVDRNFNEAEKLRFSGEFDAFFHSFANGVDLVKGSEVCIDYLPAEGTVVTVGGRKLAVIPGHDFYHALLRLWIGKPLQPSMKTGLLGSTRAL